MKRAHIGAAVLVAAALLVPAAGSAAAPASSPAPATAAPLAPPDAATVAETLKRLRAEEAPRPSRENRRWRPPRKVLLLGFGILDWTGRDAQFRAVAPGARLVVARDLASARREAVDSDVVIGFNPDICDPSLLDAGSELRWVASLAAGIDRCTQAKAVQDPDFVVTNLRGADAPPIAEHAIAMMLALAHGLDRFAVDTANGSWGSRTANAMRLQVLTGKTLLVSGLGSIGTEVAWRAHGLGMKVIATRQGGGPKPDYVDYIGQPDELLGLAARADVVVSAVPLTPQTTGLYDAKFFSVLKPTSIFINVARGASVNTDDLAQALDDNRLGGAGLDVTEPEPLPAGHRLWKSPRVLITPHISTRSDLPGEDRWIVAVENLRRYVAGEKLLLVTDPRRGY